MAMRASIFGLLALCLAAGVPAAAEPFAGSAAFREHLEFLGYSVEEKDDHLIARHSVNYIVSLKELRGGVLLTSFITSNEIAKVDRAGFHNVINGLNARAASVRYYADADVDLAAEGWFPGSYDRERFGILITEFNNDLNRLADLPAEEKRFFQ